MFSHSSTFRFLILSALVFVSVACSVETAPIAATPAVAIAAPNVGASPAAAISNQASTSVPPAASTPAPTRTAPPTLIPPPTPTPLNPLMIQVERARSYPGSDITIEQTLTPGSNYNRYIASYRSDGLKIYALLTVPRGPKPATGFPVIIFNHGYISPSVYRTTERYVAYVDEIARSGYIVFKSDYRGHGSSEGVARGGYGSPDYTTDVLNAVSSMKKYADADPNRIGMWGHSMGGFLTLRALVIDPSIKAAVIWGGVVASYPDMLSLWHHTTGSDAPDADLPSGLTGRGWRNGLVQQYGTPAENPEFWKSISANSFLGDISAPIQLHQAQGDTEVPPIFSDLLYKQILAVDGTVELYKYPGDNHNISANFATAMERTIQFLNKYVKGS